MKVLKFGGTSVGSAERIKNVAKLVIDGQRKIVVLSAMSGTTNALVEISGYFKRGNNDGAAEIIGTLQKKYYQVAEELLAKPASVNNAKQVIDDVFAVIRGFTNHTFGQVEENTVLAQGEILSTNLFYLHTQEIGVKSVLLPALDYMRIDENGEPVFPVIKKELSALLGANADKEIVVTQGFICRNHLGQVDNLKRGGSDYSASIVGAAIASPEIQIWTDIDGVHNNDPRFVQNTRPLAELSFDEAAELAYFGAKVLHPLSVLPAKMGNIPVLLKNTMQPDAKGTTIHNDSIGDGVKAIAAKDGLTAIKIKSSRMLLAYGFLRKIFEIFENYKTSIDMVTTSEVALSLTIDNTTYLPQILDELKSLGSVEVDTDQTIICVVGNLIAEDKGYAADILQSLKNISVRMISYGGSHHNISILIDTANKQKALQLLHENLFK